METPKPKKKMNVVVVDDNSDSAELYKILLETRGHKVHIAGTGQRGIDIIQTETPDIAFIDIGLPDFDGYEVAKRLKKSGSKVILVALTGYGRDEDKERAKDAGFDHHLLKPVGLKNFERFFSETTNC